MFVKSNRGWLALVFDHKGERCIEYLHLTDGRDNRREAERKLKLIAKQIRDGTFDYANHFPNSKRLALLKPEGEPTLGEFAQAWLNEQRTHLTPASHSHYGLLLKNHLLAYPIATKRISAVSDGDVNLLVGSLREGFGEGSRWSGLRTVNMVLARFRTIFATAKRRKLVADDPMQYVRNLRQPKPDVDPFDLDEAKRLIEAAQGWERAFLAVLLFTGMRPNEALALRWDTIDWRKGLVRVRQNIGRGGRIGLPKTESSDREVEIPAFVRRELHEQRARSELKGGLVFPSASATPIALSNFRRRNWPRILRRAGVATRTIYQCRHTCARLLLEHGDHVQHVAAQLGHASPRMVVNVYGRWLERPRSVAMEALDRSLSITPISPFSGGELAGSHGNRR